MENWISLNIFIHASLISTIPSQGTFEMVPLLYFCFYCETLCKAWYILTVVIANRVIAA